MAEPEPTLSEMISQLMRNSQASVALVTLAIIDEWLQKLLLHKMRKLSNTVAARIFDSNGPLHELALKIDIAYAFELIDDDTLKSLRALKDLRNRFAHTQAALHFDSPDIDKLCQKLPGWKRGTDNQKLFDAVAMECIKKISATRERLLMAHALMKRSDS